MLSFFLLATPDDYYIYDFEDGELLLARKSLEEVYKGLKVGRHHGIKEGNWEPVEAVLFAREIHYFPMYQKTEDTNVWTLVHTMKEYPGW